MTTSHGGSPRRLVGTHRQAAEGRQNVDPDASTDVLRAAEPPADASRRDRPVEPRRERPAAAPPEEPARRNGMGTPALVLGLLAVATCWTGWAGVVLGLPAVVAGYLGARRAFHNLATDGASSLGGLVTGAIGLVAGAIIVWPTLFGTGQFGDGLTLDQCMAQSTTAREMHMCKSQHLQEFNQRYPGAAE